MPIQRKMVEDAKYNMDNIKANWTEKTVVVNVADVHASMISTNNAATVGIKSCINNRA